MNVALTDAQILGIWEQGESTVSGFARSLLPLMVCASHDEIAAVQGMPLGAVNAALIAVREATFGTALRGRTACPGCGTVVDLDLDTRQLQASGDALDPCEVGTDDGWRAVHRLPTVGDLAAVSACTSAEQARVALAESLLLEVRGPGGADRCGALPEQVISAISESVEVHDPLCEIRLELTCPDCHRPLPVLLDMGSYLWSELAVAASKIVQDVHVLAAAYGWREADVLALSPLRRRAYLRLVTA
jgi:hypothetical protein